MLYVNVKRKCYAWMYAYYVRCNVITTPECSRECLWFMTVILMFVLWPIHGVHCTLVLQFTRRTLYVQCTWITWKVIVTIQRTLCTEQWTWGLDVVFWFYHHVICKDHVCWEVEPGIKCICGEMVSCCLCVKNYLWSVVQS